MKQELNKSDNHQEWHINDDSILGEDGTTNRFHLIKRNVKKIQMASPPPEPEYRNETAQEGNGGFTVMTEILY